MGTSTSHHSSRLKEISNLYLRGESQVRRLFQVLEETQGEEWQQALFSPAAPIAAIEFEEILRSFAEEPLETAGERYGLPPGLRGVGPLLTQNLTEKIRIRCTDGLVPPLWVETALGAVTEVCYRELFGSIPAYFHGTAADIQDTARTKFSAAKSRQKAAFNLFEHYYEDVVQFFVCRDQPLYLGSRGCPDIRMAAQMRREVKTLVRKARLEVDNDSCPEDPSMLQERFIRAMRKV